MKKSISISISGIAFTFEYDAYERLNSYISLLSKAYSKEEASTEIIADIEARISELVLSWQSVNDQVVTLDCIDKIIEQMGPPDVEPATAAGNKESKFSNNTESKHSNNTESKYTDNTVGSHATRRLYRNPEGLKLGGVVNGLASYLNRDVTLFRILFLVAYAFFIFSTEGLAIPIGAGVYIVLWCIIPMAKNARQKMEMSGRPITIESLKRNIEEEFDSHGPSVVTEVSSVFSHILIVVVKIIRFIIIAISMAVGVMLVLALLASIIFTVFAFTNYISIIPMFVIHNPIFVIITLSIAAITPLVLLIYTIAKLTFSVQYNRVVLSILSGLLLLSWMGAAYIMIDSQLDRMKSYSSTVSNTHKLSSNVLKINPKNGYCYGIDDFDFKEGVIRESVKVHLVADTTILDSTIVVEYRITTKAPSTSEAIDMHDVSDIDYRIVGSSFDYSEYMLFSAENNDRHDGRDVTITIRHPKSMKINGDYRYVSRRR